MKLDRLQLSCINGGANLARQERVIIAHEEQALMAHHIRRLELAKKPNQGL